MRCVLFAARNACAAGWRTVVVTSGTDALADAARHALDGVEVMVQPSAADTVMVFGDQTERGPQRVPTVADPLDLARAGVAGMAADVVHVAPIMGEVGPGLIDQIGARSRVGVTPQGLLRRRNRAGRLELVVSADPWWAAQVDAVVLSEDEHRHLAGTVDLRRAAVAVTRGPRGCWGWQGDDRVELAGVPVLPSPAGTIGAGDVFASTLFMALADHAAFGDAMDQANRRAAAHVAGSTQPT
jgi:sugar/nucleoside kinase (ribokinase family)